MVTNSQTALRAEDFTSNEDVQIRLQREFADLMPPWFYQIKRGEWDKMMGGASGRQRYRDPDGIYRKLTSKEVAQAVLSFAGFPGEAKDNIRSFLNKTKLFSIARESEVSYDTIYTDNAVAAQMLLPAVILRKVWKQVARDKVTDPWLDYARFHIVWLIAELLREHYSIHSNLFPVQRSMTVAAQIDDWFDPLYTIAIAAVGNAVAELQRRGDFNGYREFFRTPANYRLVQANLQGAARMASTFGDAFVNLPPP